MLHKATISLFQYCGYFDFVCQFTSRSKKMEIHTPHLSRFFFYSAILMKEMVSLIYIPLVSNLFVTSFFLFQVTGLVMMWYHGSRIFSALCVYRTPSGELSAFLGGPGPSLKSLPPGSVVLGDIDIDLNPINQTYNDKLTKDYIKILILTLTQ